MMPATDVLLDRRYKLASRIATGGMGEVWAATDEVLGRRVAVKILRREYAEDLTFRERFRAEARHTAALSHAGIAAVFDYSTGAPTDEEEGAHSPYLVMELINGEPLSAVIAREGAMRAQLAFDIVAQVARALQTAHDNGVIHRDVKPGNILLTPGGTVKITDFGISRATNSVPLTKTGTIMGTAFYISPEQASGRSVTPASDIYSLGVVAYECLSGRRPFGGDTAVSVALAQVREEPPALGPDVSPEASDLVMRMLAKDPAQRPNSAGSLAAAALVLSQSAPTAPTGALPMTDDPEATQVTQAIGPLTGAESSANATPAGPATAISRPGTDTDPGFRLPAARGSSRWLPHVVGLAVMAVLLLLVVRYFTNDATTTATSATTPSASATSTAGQEAILVRASEYRGQPVSRARAALRALGLQVVLRRVRAGPATPVGTVTGVDPTGRLSPDTAVTLEYAQEGSSDHRGPGNGKDPKPPKVGRDDKRGHASSNGEQQKEGNE
jgi:serine/threonine protein kinase